MPRGKKRTYKRRTNQIGTLNTGSMPGFPNNKLFKVRYVTSGTLDATAGTIAKVYFRANGPYDPEVAVGGHQPLGWDQLEPYYNHSTCIGSKITVALSSSGPSAQYGPSAIAGIYLADDATVPTSTSQIMEQGLGKWRYVAQTSQKGSDAVSITNTFSAKKFFGVVDVADVDKLRSDFFSTPLDEAIYTVWLGSMDPAEDPTPFAYVVTIEYILRLSEPKSLAQS